MGQEYETGGRPRSEEETEALRSPQTFADFDHWVDEQLELLVSRWIHTAAPRASASRGIWWQRLHP